MRRIQGLCLLLLGGLLGWFAGGELAVVARNHAVWTVAGALVAVTLVVGLVLVFVGLILVVGPSVWPGQAAEEENTTRTEKR